MAARTNLRKPPSQERSRGLVDAILEGAARVLRSSPSDAPLAPDPKAPRISTNRVAEIAGVSIGSLYQYFPGKEAILAALAKKRLRSTFDALLEEIDAAQARALPLDEAVSNVVDRFVEMKVTNSRLDAGVIEETLRHGLTGDAFSLDAEYTQRFAAAIERWKPAVREDLPPELGAYVLFQAIRAVMIMGSLQRQDLIADERLRGEMKRLMLGYLRA
jgi:AcrR family transcriptional regulator